jgi:hypothetical protein
MRHPVICPKTNSGVHRLCMQHQIICPTTIAVPPTCSVTMKVACALASSLMTASSVRALDTDGAIWEPIGSTAHSKRRSQYPPTLVCRTESFAFAVVACAGSACATQSSSV